MVDVEIGMARSGRRAYELADIGIVPSRRTRDPEEVDISWQLDAYRFDLPLVSAPSDSVTSPATAIVVGRMGGLGVLNLEGLWSRHADPEALLAEVAELAGSPTAIARLQDLHAAPIDGDLMASRISEIRDAGVTVAAALSPQQVETWHHVALEAGLEVLVIHGAVVSAEHVSSREDPLNLKDFIARYDIPVVVGGCASTASALHLMRTGAAGVLVGVGSGTSGHTRPTLGVGVGQATAIADASAARSRHLEETGRSVQLIADGGITAQGDLATAIAVGADAVMVSDIFAAATDAPAAGAHWDPSTSHRSLPRGDVRPISPTAPLAEIVGGPGHTPGATNLAEGLRRALALSGCGTLKDLQRTDLTVAR